MSISVVDKISYTLFISSNDKVSGTNNNATFNVNWISLFPNNDHDAYKVLFCFQTVGGYYKDYPQSPMFYNSAKVTANFRTKSYSLDTSTNSPSYTLGIIQRDIQSTTSSSNTLSCYYGWTAGKTISRPQGDQLTITIYNNYTYSYLNNVWVSNGPSGNGYAVGNIVYYAVTTLYYSCILAATNQIPTNVTYWVGVVPASTNSPYVLLTDTNSAGVATTDMTAWNMVIEFIPCTDTIF